MAKNLYINGLAGLLLFALLYSVPAVSQDAGSRIKAVYESQIGVREKTGKNDGAQVETYLKTVGLGKGFPWCAAFVKWCLLQAGIESARKINGMALSCENKNLMVYQKRWIIPGRSGDVFTLYYARLGRIGHTGFFDRVASVEYGTLVLVEGNTNSGGSRDGDGVYRRIRQLRSIHSISRWQ